MFGSARSTSSCSYGLPISRADAEKATALRLRAVMRRFMAFPFKLGWLLTTTPSLSPRLQAAAWQSSAQLFHPQQKPPIAETVGLLPQLRLVDRIKPGN